MISIKVDSKRLVNYLNAQAKKASNTLALMTELAGIMWQDVEENFDAQGRPRWEDLRPSTKARRLKKRKWPGSILQETGRLKRSIMPEATDTKAIVGTNVKYAAAQHFGAQITLYGRSSLFSQNRTTKGLFTKGRGKEIVGGKGKSTFKQRTVKIPARPFLVMSKDGIARALAAARKFFGGQ